ncbi:hypothetical protein [Paludisphaera sp.]|uniref:hypothetical protein n=1 Tax=Paludisphaera sp. TaxID=2017432 RepID=UPI00301C78DF
MKTMTRIGLPAAILLILGALAAETFAKREVGLGISAHARAARALNAGKPVDRARAVATAREHADASRAASMLGLAAAVLGVASWLFSLRRGEAGPHWMPATLLASYILWLFMLV